MKSKSIPRKSFIICILCVCAVILFNPIKVEASWTEGGDTQIYTDGEAKETEKVEKDEVGTLEKMLSTCVNSLATGLRTMLEFADCSLDRIVLGRVGSGSTKPSMFTFELIEDNPYGVVATMSYATIRGIIITGMFFIFIQKTLHAMRSNGSGQARAEYKESIDRYVVLFLSLFAMPFLFDLAIYIRNGILYLLMKGQVALSGNQTLSLINTFAETAKSSHSISDSLMYLGAVAITVWFIFEYVGIALCTVILFILYPFIVIQANYNKNALTEWCKNTFSLFMTPIMDSVLLFIPILFAVFFPQAVLVKMAICAMIIPARQITKKLAGLSNAGSGVLGTFGALMALRGAASLAHGAAAHAGRIKNAVQSGRADRESAQMEESFAAAEKAEEASALKNAGIKGMEQQKEEKERDSIGDTFDVKKENEFGMFRNGEEKNSEISEGNDEEFMNSEFSRDTYAEEAYGNGNYNSNVEDAKSGLEELENQRTDLMQDNTARREKIAGYQEEKANLSEENATMEAEDLKMGDYGASREKIARNKAKMAQLDASIAKENSAIQENMHAINGIERQRSSLLASEAPSMQKGAVSAQKMDVLRKHANINNFDTPSFAGLSHEDKAQFYRRRANRQFIKAGTNAVAGTAMMATGSLVGAGVGTFAGPGLSVPMMAAGANLGATGGDMLSTGAGRVIESGVHAVHSNRTPDSADTPTRVSTPVNGYANAADAIVDDVSAGIGKDVASYTSFYTPATNRMHSFGVEYQAAMAVKQGISNMVSHGDTINDYHMNVMADCIDKGMSYDEAKPYLAERVADSFIKNCTGNASDEVYKSIKKISLDNVKQSMEKNNSFYKSMYEDLIRTKKEFL